MVDKEMVMDKKHDAEIDSGGTIQINPNFVEKLFLNSNKIWPFLLTPAELILMKIMSVHINETFD